MTKITILSLDLYGFNKFIAEKLEELGVETTYISSADFSYKYKNTSERVVNFFRKNLLNKNIKKLKQTEYVLNELSKSKGLQDAILVVDPAHFNNEILDAVRKKTSKLIAYNYDSIAKLDLPKNMVSYFDEFYSFDIQDCETYGFRYLTNFIYLPKHEIPLEPYKTKAFVIQSKCNERIYTLSKIADQFDQLGIENYEILVYGKKQNDINPHIVFKDQRTSLEILKQKYIDSEIFVDLVRDGQLGLSFRIFEAMAMQKKIISTNKTLKDYDFYNSNNILIIDKENPIIDMNFLNNNYTPIPDEIYKKYTLESWISTVFEF